MARIIILTGGLPPEEPSENLRRLADTSRVQLRSVALSSMPEGGWLGLSPQEVAMPDGPLTVAGLGAEPPPNSTEFHLSLLGQSDHQIVRPAGPNPEERATISRLLPKLNTKRLTIVTGPAEDHGLVWEARGDLHTFSPDEAVGSGLRERLPEGDGEPLLRRMIDDSINLLNEAEFNQRRLDAGDLPINLVWPWGQGVRTPVPNLALRYGAPLRIDGPSLRFAGLARLARLRPSPVETFGVGVRTPFARVAGADIVLATLPEDEDGQDWWWREFDRQVLDHIATDLLLVLTTDDRALVLDYVAERPQSDRRPFSRRFWEDSSPSGTLHEAIAATLARD